MNMPVIKAVNDDDNIIISLLQNVTLLYNNDEDDSFQGITHFGLNDGSECPIVMSCAGERIEVSNLRCFSYEDLIIALDLHNCLFNIDIEKTIESCRKSSQPDQLEKLLRENAKLKKQLETIKKLLKDN